MKVTELLESDDYEIHNHEKLDRILVKLCEMVIEAQQEDSDYFGMVGAAVLDPDNNLAAAVNYPHEDSGRVHAERAAMELYVSQYGSSIPKGSIIITTLSPCNEHSDITADGRHGESCTELINNSTVHKVYCGYQDPSQGDDQHDERTFTLMETRNPAIRALCKKFADTFLGELVETAAWRRSAGKSKSGGLNAKGVASYRRENPGSKLQTAVTTKPSKLKKGSKAANRRKSFCARMGGVKGPMKKPNGKPTRKALALRKWNC